MGGAFPAFFLVFGQRQKDQIMTQVLVVEDDPRLGAEIVETLESAGFPVTWCRDGASARSVEIHDYSLVVLDLMLPGAHGFDLLKEWRRESDLPVIILTARSETHDKVRGFELGGDDYLTKPFWPAELVARVQARLRRPNMSGDLMEIGPLAIDVEQREAKLDGVSIELTKVEFDILAMLALRKDKAVSRQQLVERVLDEEKDGGERTLDVHVSRIRKKLGEAARHLETVWGIGYRLATEPKAKK
jgi:DNA-binding response OmpR family regulator